MKKIALIPSYEPGLEILQVVKELEENNFIIVVVNDGSGEKYDEIFDQLSSNVNYLKYDTNQGKGHALKYGFSYIKEHFDDDSIIVTLDSDGQHRVVDAIKIAEECENSTNTLILGSRLFTKDTPIKSRIGNFLARTTFLISTRHKIYDTQTGLRAFKFDMLDMLINAKGERYEYETNVLLDAVRYNIKIKEVGIETIYINNNANTHYSPFKDTYKILKEVVKFSASSLIGFLIDYLAFTCLTLIPVPDTWTEWVLACNIIARIISASVNFTINYKFVFRSKKKLWKAILEYVLLALFILGCNTLFLYLLVDKAGMNKYLAKVIVEVVMFTVSWIVQRLLVFRKRKKK